jgi:SAM-dependent methyltransferase
MLYVNLGCGTRFHPDWINFDLAPCGSAVIACDLSRGIPLPDAHCEVVYHSHVLEHLRRDDALPFLRECHRVLRPGGIVRVVVPDLEQVCREYLQQLRAVRDGDAGALANYEWITLELLDQLVRERSGGAMVDYLRCSPMPNEAYVRSRIGDEILHAEEVFKRNPGDAWRSRLRRAAETARSAYERLLCVFLFQRDAARALRLGRFRLSGEAHQWMYDSHSLGRLLRAAGFQEPAVRTAGASAIPGWSRFRLDENSEGRARKPESLFMEATRTA